MALPININIERPDLPTTEGFLEQWRVDGQCAHRDTYIGVEVKDYGADGPILRAALGHELGHAAYSSMMERADFENRSADVFKWELLAWIKYATENKQALPMPLRIGKFILDCLNTYRRGHNIGETKWEAARELVESWSRTPELLKDYEPLEPPLDAEPPIGCGEGWGFTPTINDQSQDSDNNDESEPDADDDTPDDESADDDYGRDDANADDESPIDRTERDEWLLSGEGMQASAESDYGTLQAKMLFKGWDMDHLPAMTIALLGK